MLDIEKCNILIKIISDIIVNVLKMNSLHSGLVLKYSKSLSVQCNSNKTICVYHYHQTIITFKLKSDIDITDASTFSVQVPYSNVFSCSNDRFINMISGVTVNSTNIKEDFFQLSMIHNIDRLNELYITEQVLLNNDNLYAIALCQNKLDEILNE